MIQRRIKKGMRGFLTFLALISLGGFCFAQLGGFDPREFFPDGDTIYTHNIDDVVSDNVEGGLEAGVDLVADGGITGIYTEGITDNATAWTKATNLMKGFVNYALSIIGLVAVVYLIYHGFLTLTAGSNEDQASKGRQGIRTAFIIIVGIALSWFFVSLILWLIFTISSEVTS